MYMETRVEKSKRRRKERRIQGLKRFIIMVMVVFLVLGIFIVNQTIKEYNFLDNTNILSYDFKTNVLNLLGKTYYFDLKILKKQL